MPARSLESSVCQELNVRWLLRSLGLGGQSSQSNAVLETGRVSDVWNGTDV